MKKEMFYKLPNLAPIHTNINNSEKSAFAELFLLSIEFFSQIGPMVHIFTIFSSSDIFALPEPNWTIIGLKHTWTETKLNPTYVYPGIQGHQVNALIKSFKMSLHLICF